MAETIAKITDKIVEITGNEATSAFVGKTVSRKNTKNGIVYAIGDTGYVLSTAEYKMFAAAGAIAQVVKKASKKPQRKDVQKENRAVGVRNHLDDISVRQAKHARKKTHQEAVAVIDEIDEASVSEFNIVDMDSSPFLANYPKPQFKLDEPKHVGLMDRSEDVRERLTGFFDSIGRRSRDKLISAMEEDETQQ